MKTTLLIFIISLIAFSTKAQTYYYTAAVPIINGDIQSISIDQKAKVKFNSNSYYDIEITLEVKSTGGTELSKIHLDAGSYKKTKAGNVSQEGTIFMLTTDEVKHVKVIYPADKSSFWLIMGFYPDGNMKTGAIYRNK